MEERISDLTIYDLTERELLIHRDQLEQRSKSPMVTWLLWFFLGGIGGHSYYLGNIVRAIFMTCTFGGLGFWTLIDAFLYQDRSVGTATKFPSNYLLRFRLCAREEIQLHKGRWELYMFSGQA